MPDILMRKMKEKGMTQQILSEMTGLSQPYISQIFSGRRAPTMDTFYILCKTLDVDPAELTDEDDACAIPGFTGEEIRLLFNYRSLSKEDRAFIYRIAGILSSGSG